MSRSKTTTRVCALLVSPLLALVAACGATGTEQTLIRTYFNASNVTDRGSLANITMYAWNVREKGTVTGPTVNSVSEERSRPLRVKELEQAVADAEAAEGDRARLVHPQQAGDVALDLDPKLLTGPGSMGLKTQSK